MSWAAERRYNYIAWRLSHHGNIRRVDLMSAFGISPMQASCDFAKFMALYPGAMVYDSTLKSYVAWFKNRIPAIETDSQGRLVFVIG